MSEAWAGPIGFRPVAGVIRSVSAVKGGDGAMIKISHGGDPAVVPLDAVTAQLAKFTGTGTGG